MKNFGWLFAAAQANATLGQSYLYADDSTGLPSWALLGEYGNGGSKSTGRWEYVWLPTEEDSNGSHAIPVGVYKGGHIYALHTDQPLGAVGAWCSAELGAGGGFPRGIWAQGQRAVVVVCS